MWSRREGRVGSGRSAGGEDTRKGGDAGRGGDVGGEGDAGRHADTSSSPRECSGESGGVRDEKEGDVCTAGDGIWEGEGSGATARPQTCAILA